MPRMAQYYNIPLPKGGPDTWVRRNLRRAMVLVGGLEEEQVGKILDQEGI